MTEPIRVLLVDDQELVRVGFSMVIDAEADMIVVGEATDGASAITQTSALKPDVVLMDVRMPGMDGIAATGHIRREHPTVRVLVLTTFDLDEYAFGAIHAGASGFLLKDAKRHELTGAIRAVHDGDAVLAPRVTRSLLEHLTTGAAVTPKGEDPASRLSPREHEVFLAIARGLTNAEMAQALYVSESTVKTHVSRVISKIGARDRIHAVILAHQWGHVPREP